MPSEPAYPSAAAGRLCIALAAVLWSLSGLFTRLLQVPTALGLHEPDLSGLQIAFFRALFAGLCLVPLLRFRDIRFRPVMPFMVGAFAAMNALFVSAIAYGTAANAILLQNTAPFLVYFASVYLLGERPDRRSLIALMVGLIGMVVILTGKEALSTNLNVTLMGLGSGLTYACVILCLRYLRAEAPQWLAVQNHLGSAVLLATVVCLCNGIAFGVDWLRVPTWPQLAFLAVFGSVQMGLPYWLFARGLRSVSPQEAGAITLLEPMLNPLWAYLISPERDTPPPSTWLGGALILGALTYRYLPRKGTSNE
ncbi:MAG TPA: EamA family transporter [Gemmataceae bacterium]|nr:EamA family transporter [Gemmataceae bacterium]